MSIILKGIDLPKTDGTTFQISYFTKDQFITESYPISRLIQIPKGHGRLIDEDEIYEQPHCGECNDATVDAINNAPTILDAEE